MSDFWVQGIVSHRDKQPYVQLSNEKGMIAQLSMGQARTIAIDILHMAARCEADALLLKFLESMSPAAAALGPELMMAFREYRSEIDAEQVIRTEDEPT